MTRYRIRKVEPTEIAAHTSYVIRKWLNDCPWVIESLAGGPVAKWEIYSAHPDETAATERLSWLLFLQQHRRMIDDPPDELKRWLGDDTVEPP